MLASAYSLTHSLIYFLTAYYTMETNTSNGSGSFFHVLELAGGPGRVDEARLVQSCVSECESDGLESLRVMGTTSTLFGLQPGH